MCVFITLNLRTITAALCYLFKTFLCAFVQFDFLTRVVPLLNIGCYAVMLILFDLDRQRLSSEVRVDSNFHSKEKYL